MRKLASLHARRQRLRRIAHELRVRRSGESRNDNCGKHKIANDFIHRYLQKYLLLVSERVLNF
jgi:hypothetical protein